MHSTFAITTFCVMLASLSCIEQSSLLSDEGVGLVAENLQTAPSSLVTESLGSPPGITLQAGVSAVAWGPWRLDIFARGSDSAVWHKWFDGSWHAWESLGGNTDTAIAACSWGIGRLDIFYRDRTSQRLHHKSFTGSWSVAETVGNSTILQSSPTAAAWGVNRIDVFTRGTGSDLRHIWFNGSWAADWVSEAGTAGTVASAPAAVAWGANRLDVFWKDTATSKLQHWWYDGALHPLDFRGGESLNSPPTAASRGDGLLDVLFVSATNTNTLAHTYFNKAWNSEDYALTGVGSVAPAAASWGPGRVDIFHQDSSGNAQHTILPSAPVITHKGDNGRSGANVYEQELNVSNVASTKFGRLFEIPVDGNVYAQPLYVPTLNLGAQGIRNVLYVATANNSVYMVDADTGAQLVRRSFGNPIPVPYADFTTGSQWGEEPNLICVYNLLPEVGILSTPTIDLASKTMYVTSLRADTDMPLTSPTLPPPAIPSACDALSPTSVRTYTVQLHALDITTLNERTGSPVNVAPTFSGSQGLLRFDARRQAQRPGLLLSNGVVYLGFGAYHDHAPYYGWVVGYDASTLAQRHVFVTTPNENPTIGGAGGIWNSGQGLTADSSGNIYFLTGNGVTDPNNNNYASAALKLTANLSLASYFIPWNHAYQNVTDMDLGSAGVALVPGTNYLVGGGKEGVIYLLDRSNLGGYNASADRVVYEDLATRSNPACADQAGLSNIHSTPVFWNTPSGLRFYIWGEEDFVRSYAISGPAFTPAGETTARAACGMPGGVLSISANKSVAGTGVIWGTVPTANAVAAVVPGKLYAFDAENMQQLWSTDISSSTERHAKFAVSTVSNGKVYVPAFGPASEAVGAVNTYSGKVIVYGLKSK